MTVANFWNDIIVGLALIALGAYNYYRRADERVGSVGSACSSRVARPVAYRRAVRVRNRRRCQ